MTKEQLLKDVSEGAILNTHFGIKKITHYVIKNGVSTKITTKQHKAALHHFGDDNFNFEAVFGGITNHYRTIKNAYKAGVTA